jgi:hypothetical protein
MAVATYDDLLTHIGHDIEVAVYGQSDNVALECVTCYEVLIDFDMEE